MRKLLLFITLLLAVHAKAQLATFESLPLSGTDTFYVNAAHHMMDMGFNDGGLHFPYVYDTSYGGYWSSGFAYSNKKDSVTSGSVNLYSAKAGRGYNGSDKYVVCSPGYSSHSFIRVAATHDPFVPQGVYLTNSTYAYNSMRSGDAFAKKFGGATGNDADWFAVTAYGYRNGVRKADSVVFYLADFRSSNNAQDYIVKEWTYMNLQTLGTVDSLYFSLSSSDNGSFGMNTPGFFCLDNFSVNIPITGVPSVPATGIAKIFPNPAAGQLNVELISGLQANVTVYDVAGHLVMSATTTNGKIQLNTAGLANGMYLLKLDDGSTATGMRFTKQ